MDYDRGGPATLTSEATAGTEEAPQEYAVAVNVSEPAIRVLLLAIEPERVQLSGRAGNRITWTLSGAGGGGAEFESADDITFLTQGGRDRFHVTFDPISKTITATVNGTNENQTIYTYFLTVHFPTYNVAVRVDPEVDNPPPPPT